MHGENRSLLLALMLAVAAGSNSVTEIDPSLYRVIGHRGSRLLLGGESMELYFSDQDSPDQSWQRADASIPFAARKHFSLVSYDGMLLLLGGQVSYWLCLACISECRMLFLKNRFPCCLFETPEHVRSSHL
jgi:hypothetical protein